MSRPLLILFLILSALPMWGRSLFADMDAARAWCDAHPDAPTGIWRVPGENILVLVHQGGNPDEYLLTVVESENGAIAPGITIGVMTATTDPKAFRLKMKGKGISDRLSSLAATLTDGGESLTIAAPSVGMKFFPLRLLPYFGRMLMLSYNDPARRLPRGFRKVYPLPQEGGGGKILRL